MDATSYTSWQLARLAEVSDPDEHDGIGFSADQGVTPRDGSPGARFLRSVAYDVAEFVNDESDDQDQDERMHEIADGAVPVYTHELWQTFVDLAAYTEDVSDELEKVAQLALYMIAARLAAALIEAEQGEVV